MLIFLFCFFLKSENDVRPEHIPSCALTTPFTFLISYCPRLSSSLCSADVLFCRCLPCGPGWYILQGWACSSLSELDDGKYLPSFSIIIIIVIVNPPDQSIGSHINCGTKGKVSVS